MVNGKVEPVIVRQRRPGSAVERLRQELEGLGLPPYQARTLAALLQVGTANSIQLAKLSGVPRTSTYQVMEALVAQGLIERLPAPGPARWTCHGAEHVVQVLDAIGRERLRQYQAQLQRVSQTVAALDPFGHRGTGCAASSTEGQRLPSASGPVTSPMPLASRHR